MAKNHLDIGDQLDLDAGEGLAEYVVLTLLFAVMVVLGSRLLGLDLSVAWRQLVALVGSIVAVWP